MQVLGAICLVDREQGAAQMLIDRTQILSLLLAAHIPISEDDEGDARIGEVCHVVEDRNAGDGDHMLDARDTFRGR